MRSLSDATVYVWTVNPARAEGSREFSKDMLYLSWRPVIGRAVARDRVLGSPVHESRPRIELTFLALYPPQQTQNKLSARADIDDSFDTNERMTMTR